MVQQVREKRRPRHGRRPVRWLAGFAAFALPALAAAAQRQAPPGPLEAGYAFVSRNVLAGGTLAQAAIALREPAQQQFQREAERDARAVDPAATVAGSIGNWKDGAEDSVLIQMRGNDGLAYVAAELGLAHRQKEVLVFTVRAGGRDVLWIVRARTRPWEAIPAAMDAAGLPFRTLVPVSDGAVIEVFDAGGVEGGKVSGLAARYDIRAERYGGGGQWLGGDSREEGRAAFARIVRAYEAAHR